MKTIEIIAFKREDKGKQHAKKLRKEGYVPGIVYGEKEHVHFYTPMIMFKDIVYTPEVHIIDLNIEGEHYECVLQDIQFHPVSDVILHADFLILQDDKPVKVDIPVKFYGTAPGVVKGGRLAPKLRKIRIKALPKDLPDFIEVDVSKLDLGRSVKIRDLKLENLEILNSPQVSIAVIDTPRTLKSLGLEDEEEEGAEAEAETEGAEESKEEAAE